MNNLLEKIYNPDVLSCLANLSNDEVFTPPEVANNMIDLLPKELFESDTTTFLDPCCKSGVFLREIMKRLLNAKFPNYEEKIAAINEKKLNKMKLTNEDMAYEKALQEKIDWICHKQLYGISITRLTSLLSRRTLYCSKNANSKYSISRFNTEFGNIMFVDVKHTFKNGKCIYCGASESEYGEEKRGKDLESHAYQFIHDENIVKELDMKFDVIIGNPPYQLNVGEQQESYAIPIYHKFIQTAKNLNPEYLCMIVPSRWFVGGRGLDEFREEMLKDDRIIEIHDYINANECFPGVEIKGGVCYFLWNKNYHGICRIVTYENGKVIDEAKRPLNQYGNDIFIRLNKAISIIEKVKKKKEESFNKIVSVQTPFGLYSSFKDYKKNKIKEDDIKLYANKITGYIPSTYKITKGIEYINKWKLFVPKAIGSGNSKTDWVKPLIGEPNSICTQTYLVLGPFKSKKETENCYSYTQTKFFHFMLTLLKNTQDAMAKVYSLVPMQDFSQSWNDEELYKKYDLTKEEINYIETMVRPMSDEEEDT